MGDPTDSSVDEKSTRPPRWLVSVLVGACLLAVWIACTDLHNYPPYLDYDSATLGIFVNNVTFHDEFDHRLNPALDFQSRYRGFWAAQFLPVAVPLSWLQSALRLPPDEVGIMLRVVSLALGLCGCFCAALVAVGNRRLALVEGIFVVAFTFSLPPFLLYARTGPVNFLVSFCLYWVAVLLIVRFIASGAARYLYGAGIVAGYYALVPYAPILTLPLVAIWLVWRRGMLRQVLLNKHLYAAGAIALLIYIAVPYGLATSQGRTYESLRAQASRFVALRSRRTVSWDHLQLALLIDKATKLVHQHFYFRRDDLGDPTREDQVWTLDAPHLVWLGLLPFGLVGLWTGLRERDEATRVFGTVAACSYLLAFSFSFPEGRYLLTAVPCYAAFVLGGLRRMARSPTVRIGVLTGALVLMAANTHALVRGEYNASMIRLWKPMAGMQEALALIRGHSGLRYNSSERIFIVWPGLSFKERLYLQMLGNFQIAVPPADTIASHAASGRTLFAVAEARDHRAIGNREQQGFRLLGEVVDPVSGRRLVVMADDES